MFYLKITTQTPATVEIGKLLRILGRFFTNFLFRVRIQTKNSESCRSPLHHSGSIATSDFVTPDPRPHLPLIRLQNKAIKIIKPTNTESLEELFQHLNIIILPKLYILSVGKFMHSYHNKLLPNPFDNYFIPISSIHSHSTRLAATSYNLFSPRVNSSSGKCSLTFVVPKMWSLIPNEIKYSTTLTFEWKLKKYLLYKKDTQLWTSATFHLSRTKSCEFYCNPAYFMHIYFFVFFLSCRDDHHPVLPVGYPEGWWVCNRIQISKNCFQTGTGYGSGYPKHFYRYFEDSDFWKKLHIAKSFIFCLQKQVLQPSAPWFRVCLWCKLCTAV